DDDGRPGARRRRADRAGRVAMTVAVLLAALAGVFAAASIVELVRIPRVGGRGDRRRDLPGGGHLGAMTVLLARIARRTATGRFRRGRPDLATRIAAAGTPLGLTPADVVALKAACALIAALAALPCATALPGRLWIA